VTDADDAEFSAAFDEIRQLIHADGGDMEIASFDGTTVTIDLVLETAHCIECVMPRRFLERVTLDIFRNSGVVLDAVVVNDPRDAEARP
jgi:Fe-S cluster biogenesis protein NfuA